MPLVRRWIWRMLSSVSVSTSHFLTKDKIKLLELKHTKYTNKTKVHFQGDFTIISLPSIKKKVTYSRDVVS